MRRRRRAARVAIVLLLFVPSCVLVYSIACGVVGEYAEPIVAPRPPWVIIDHFHLEVFLEALFLATGLIVVFPRTLVWITGTVGIPLLPHFLLTAVTPESWAPGPPLWRDLLLWSLEGIVAGLLSCGIWEVGRRVVRGTVPLVPAGDTSAR
jgi:hypothetical protein